MAQYINKEYACSHPFANGHYDKVNANRDFIRGHESYKEWLEDIPAADVRENVKGKWKRRIVDGGFNADWICSECGYRVKYDFCNFNFCPNCGADMRGDKDD